MVRGTKQKIWWLAAWAGADGCRGRVAGSSARRDRALDGSRAMEAPGLGSEVAGAGAKQGWAELEGLLRTIDKSSNRLDSLDSIREAVKGNGCLPDPPLRAIAAHAGGAAPSPRAVEHALLYIFLH